MLTASSVRKVGERKSVDELGNETLHQFIGNCKKFIRSDYGGQLPEKAIAKELRNRTGLDYPPAVIKAVYELITEYVFVVRRKHNEHADQFLQAFTSSIKEGTYGQCPINSIDHSLLNSIQDRNGVILKDRLLEIINSMLSSFDEIVSSEAIVDKLHTMGIKCGPISADVITTYVRRHIIGSKDRVTKRLDWLRSFLGKEEFEMITLP